MHACVHQCRTWQRKHTWGRMSRSSGKRFCPLHISSSCMSSSCFFFLFAIVTRSKRSQSRRKGMSSMRLTRGAAIVKVVGQLRLAPGAPNTDTTFVKAVHSSALSRVRQPLLFNGTNEQPSRQKVAILGFGHGSQLCEEWRFEGSAPPLRIQSANVTEIHFSENGKAPQCRTLQSSTSVFEECCERETYPHTPCVLVDPAATMLPKQLLQDAHRVKHDMMNMVGLQQCCSCSGASCL